MPAQLTPEIRPRGSSWGKRPRMALTLPNGCHLGSSVKRIVWRISPPVVQPTTCKSPLTVEQAIWENRASGLPAAAEAFPNGCQLGSSLKRMVCHRRPSSSVAIACRSPPSSAQATLLKDLSAPAAASLTFPNGCQSSCCVKRIVWKSTPLPPGPFPPTNYEQLATSLRRERRRQVA